MASWLNNHDDIVVKSVTLSHQVNVAPWSFCSWGWRFGWSRNSILTVPLGSRSGWNLEREILHLYNLSFRNLDHLESSWAILSIRWRQEVSQKFVWKLFSSAKGFIFQISCAVGVRSSFAICVCCSRWGSGEITALTRGPAVRAKAPLTIGSGTICLGGWKAFRTGHCCWIYCSLHVLEEGCQHYFRGHRYLSFFKLYKYTQALAL